MSVRLIWVFCLLVPRFQSYKAEVVLCFTCCIIWCVNRLLCFILSEILFTLYVENRRNALPEWWLRHVHRSSWITHFRVVWLPLSTSLIANTSSNFDIFVHFITNWLNILTNPCFLSEGSFKRWINGWRSRGTAKSFTFPQTKGIELLNKLRMKAFELRNCHIWTFLELSILPGKRFIIFKLTYLVVHSLLIGFLKSVSIYIYDIPEYTVSRNSYFDRKLGDHRPV